MYIHIASVYTLYDLMRFKKTVECHEKLPWLYIFFIVIFLQVNGSVIFMSLRAYIALYLFIFLIRVRNENITVYRYYVNNVLTCKYYVGNMHINIIISNHIICTPSCARLMFMAEGLITSLTGVGSFNCYFCTRPFLYIIIYVGGRYGYKYDNHMCTVIRQFEKSRSRCKNNYLFRN